MNNQAIRNRLLCDLGLSKLGPRFQRTQSRQSSLSLRKGLSQSASEPKLHKFYVPSSKISKYETNKVQNNKNGTIMNVEDIIFANGNRNEQKPMEQKKLQKQVKQLRKRNQQLELKVNMMTKSLNEHLNKQNRPMNKMREKTQKQRMKQLEFQNHHLREIVLQLKQQLKDLRESKLTQQTENSIFQNINSVDQNQSINLMKLDDQLQINEKQIFNLNETVKKLQLEMDFLNRRNHNQISTIKDSYQKQFKGIKDKFSDMVKENSQLKRRNMELTYIIKGTRGKRCNCQKNGAKESLNNSILSLSSD